MFSMRRNPGRFNRNRNKRRFGSKVEIIKKPVPRISTLNKKIKKIQDKIELKYYDTEYTASVSNSGVLHLINPLATGLTQITRIGSEIEATSVQFRFTINTVPANLNGTQVVRMILFWDKQANGAAPTLAGNPVGGTGTAALLNNDVITDLVYAPFQYENQERFRVLYDKAFSLSPKVWQEHDNGTPTVITELLSVGLSGKKKIKLNRKVKYDGITGGIDTINSNSLYMAFVSTEASNLPVVYSGFRFYFKDA